MTLVPQDQPYGDRKKNIAGMQTAGLPLESPTQPAPYPGSPSRPAGGGVGFDPLLELKPLETPTETPTYPERLEEALLSSPNPLMREAARRILGDR